MGNTNPDAPNQPTFRPQNPIRVRDMQRMWGRANAVGNSFSEGGITNAGGAMGPQLITDPTPDGFWARLTVPPQPDTDLYSYIEVQDDGTGDGWNSPNGCMFGTYNATPLSGNQNIPIPGPPTGLSTSSSGTYACYVVSATWYNNYTGQSVQSEVSNEVFSSSRSSTLSWTAPNPCTGFTLLGYSIWRGGSIGGSENTLAGTTTVPTTTFSDGGGGTTPRYYIPGGNAGPIVWMSPHSAYDDFYKFIDPTPLPAVIAVVNSSTPNGDGLYDATIQMYDPTTQTWSSGPNIWLRDANS